MTVTNQQRQVLILSLILAAIAGVLLWMYGGRILPRPDGAAALDKRTRLDVPESFDDPLFARKDFQDLRGVAGVPVKPFTEVPRNVDIFRASVR